MVLARVKALAVMKVKPMPRNAFLSSARSPNSTSEVGPSRSKK
jgi:hypothetical protein